MHLHKTNIITAVSIIVVLVTVFLDIDLLANGWSYLLKLSSTTGHETSVYRLATLNFFYDIIGMMLVIFVLGDLIQLKAKSSLKEKALWMFAWMSLVLLLPVYHKHPDLAGKIHGHSFWNGGFHLH